MYAVRLLPREYQESIIKARRNRRLLAVECVIAIILTIALIVLNLYASNLNQELGELKAENDRIFQRIESLRPVEAMQNRVRDLTGQMAEVLDTCPNWGEILPRVGNALPPDVSLIGLNAKYSDGASTIVITGFAPDHETVSRLMKNLADVNNLGEISCRYSTAESGRGQVYDDIQFELTIPVVFNITDLTGGSGQ